MSVVPERTIGRVPTGSFPIHGSQGFATPQRSGPSPEEFYATLPLRDTQSIRLLYLDPLSQDTLTGQLWVVSLATSPRYDVLSYVWACHTNREDCEPGGDCCELDGAYAIQCGLARVPITKNGYFALQSLAKQLGRITIWVDAICVNQRDIKERSQQVKLMKDIYSFARTTYIWLDDKFAASGSSSDATTASDLPFDNLAKFMESFQVFPGVLQTLLLSHPKAFNFWSRTRRNQAVDEALGSLFRGFKEAVYIGFSSPVLVDLSLSFQREYPAADIDNVLKRSWFRRAWTFQEFILSHHPVMVSRNKVLDCDYFFKMLSSWGHSEGPVPLDQALIYWKDLLSLWLNIDRPTEWNGKEIRKQISTGTSFAAYSEKMEAYAIHSSWLFVLPFILWINLHWASSFLIIMALFSRYLDFWFISFPIVGLPISVFLYYMDGYISLLAYGSAFTKLLPKSSLTNGVIRSLRERKSTDERDKSYSLYGILSALDLESGRPSTEFARAILSEPDYNKSPPIVYFELFSDLLEWRADLVVLLIDAGKGLLPYHEGHSWVPDWSSEGLRTWLDEDYLYGADVSAAPGIPAIARIDGLELCVNGLVMGNCLSPKILPCENSSGLLVQIQEEDDPGYSTLRSFLQWLKAVQQEAGLQPANRHLKRAVYEVLVGKILRDLHQLREDAIRNLREMVTAMTEGLRSVPREEEAKRAVKRAHGLISEEIPKSTESEKLVFNDWYQIMMTEAVKGGSFDSLRELKAEIEKKPKILRWHEGCVKGIQGRRSLFVDSNGYLGSGPLYMKEGDRVALIAGLPVPAILRRVNDGNEDARYYFVGPAFVSGMMTGESLSGDEQFTELRLV
ncbi:heterokaryon incompatibility protein-domain-containing protein [Nemania abortiva]|nr:heterokaryon incompatibility protein-domain-containing protein [Nemania abortiva]